MSANFDPTPAARMLAEAWRSGKQISELPVEIQPRNLNEGYDVQDQLFAQMNEPLAGWKLGVGSPAAMRGAGLDRPLVGRILASHCHHSGDTVQLPSAAPITVEFEIGFVLGRDIAPGTTLASPLDAVASVHATFELVLSRFVNRRAAGWPSFAADGVGFEALIVGDPIDPAQIDDVARTVVVSLDGKETARGLGGDDLTNAIASLGYLINHARDRGVTLKRGELVSTGANAKPFDVAGADFEIVARYLQSELRARTRLR